ncbi:MAG: FAD-dependent oxidoreductase [Myxococcaceae bacterium]|nr:FAD-dependent oxidoreductase [Myxococcaceae bacterium]MCA3011169.1 FAD-dependent oxidoreductase [Myxococcaceae bacterium]
MPWYLWTLAALATLIAVGWFVVPSLLRALIKRRLSNYRVEVTVPDPGRPERLTSPRRVAVLGGGVAGLTAAITLARRGFEVELFEANAYLGGKLGSWKVPLPGGDEAWVSHGFHAFFSNYFNLNRFLDSLGLRREFTSIGEYVILGTDGAEVRFGALDTTPVFNLFSLARKGVFRFRDVLKAPARDVFGVFLEYDERETFARYDDVSFADFDRLTKLPPRLKLAFNTFARAFFSDEDKLSLAELIKSFHFYYLGQDGGLVYDYPVHDYEPQFLSPMRQELDRHGAKVHLSTRVEHLEALDRGFRVNGSAFDRVVLATDVVGARSVVTAATGLPDAVKAPFAQLATGQRYAVLRIWIDKDVREGFPPFVITDREQVLDAFATYHRFEHEAQTWAKKHGGAVLELHCYAVPEALSPDEVRTALLGEFERFFPEVKGFTLKHEVFQLNRNFTAFHLGMYRHRPGVESGAPGLVCAGDWVKLPFPAMLLEAACASGLLAANALLREAGLREEPISSVPPRGVMAGLPQPPARKQLVPGAGKTP